MNKSKHKKFRVKKVSMFEVIACDKEQAIIKVQNKEGKHIWSEYK